MTRRDLLEGNVDLIKKASEILAGKQVKQLEALISDENDSLKIETSFQSEFLELISMWIIDLFFLKML